MGSLDLLEGIGRGTMDRIVMGKFKIDIDLSGRNSRIGQEGRGPNGSDPVSRRSLKKSNVPKP